MVYDFTTTHDRRHTGSAKWDQVKQFDPPLPEDTISMSVADMDFPLAPPIADAVIRYFETAIPGYTRVAPSYFEAVVDWMKTYWRWDIEPDWIIPTNGVVPDLAQAVRLLTEEDDGVIIFTPVYPPFHQVVREQNRRLLRIPLIEDEAVFSIDWEAFEKAAADPGTKMLLFCNPHNPVGRVWTEEELLRILDICQKYDLAVVSDDIHADIIAKPYRHVPMASLDHPLAQSVITATAPSKSFNLAAFSISNLIISDETMRNRFRGYRQQARYTGPPVPSWLAAEAAYRHGRPWFDEMLEVVAANDRRVREAFARFAPQVRISERQGTYVMWLDMRAIEPDPVKLFELLGRQARVIGNSGETFGEEGAGWIRLNLATTPEIVEEALRRLENTLTSYKVTL